jgi:chromosome segregation ATPase
MTNHPTDPMHSGFLDALRNTQQQVKALETQYGQVSKEMQEQLARLKSELEAAQQERDILRQQVKDLQQQLDDSRSEAGIYRHSLHTVLRRPFTFTKEELEEMEQNRIPFSEILAELEQE